jgi:hypothetical protein
MVTLGARIMIDQETCSSLKVTKSPLLAASAGTVPDLDPGPDGLGSR